MWNETNFAQHEIIPAMYGIRWQIFHLDRKQDSVAMKQHGAEEGGSGEENTTKGKSL